MQNTKRRICRRLLTVLTVWLVTCVVAGLTIQAQDAPALAITAPAYQQQGEGCQVSVALRQVTDCTDGKLTVTYDKGLLKLTKAELGAAMEGAYAVINDQVPGQVIVAFVGKTALPQDGLLLQLEFETAADAKDGAVASLTADSQGLFDANGKDLGDTVKDGKATITMGEKPVSQPVSSDTSQGISQSVSVSAEQSGENANNPGTGLIVSAAVLVAAGACVILVLAIRKRKGGASV